VEWFWHYPAITLPPLFALGAASAPSLLRPAEAPRRGPRIALVVMAAVAAVALVPFFLSERYTKDAVKNWRDDLPQAYSNLDRAADLNPWSEKPLAAEAVIAESAGEPQRALAALSEAQERTPDEWTLYYLEARAKESTGDPVGARRAIERALALNPHGPEILELQKSLEGGSSGG